MKAEKRKQLEEKLREMIDLSEQGESKQPQMQAQAVATKVIIRRRKGEQDKRIFRS